MSILTTEKQFFHSIAPKLLALVEKERSNASALHKNSQDNPNDIVTQVDLSVDKLLAIEIKKYFPTDKIYSEETVKADSKISNNRTWIIDPICGTIVIAADMNFFCTNIALVEDKKIVAACVIDYVKKEYIWSLGNGVYINNAIYSNKKKNPTAMIEIDLTALIITKKGFRKQYGLFLAELLLETTYNLVSFSSSLSFTYVALGRIDGYIGPAYHIWDIAASNFLMEQSGVVITDWNGNPWTFDSTNILAIKDKRVHETILKILQNHFVK
jgi:myo-inositol-1(or 4)-monophosphatase